MLKACSIAEGLDVSSMPSTEDLEQISRKYDKVIAVVRPDELAYDVSVLKSLGVDVKLLPTRASNVPTVLELFSAVMEIRKAVKKGLKVLVHCSSGKSRSCSLAAAYLMVSDNMSLLEALTTVKLKRGADLLITEYQMRRLKILEYVLNLLTPRGLEGCYVFGSKFGFGRGLRHASLTLELVCELIRDLRKELGLTRTDEVVAAATAILHDVGARYVQVKHHVKSYELIRNSVELYATLGSEIREAVAWASYYHHSGAGNPLSNREMNDLMRWCVTKSAALVRVGNSLAMLTNLEPAKLEAEILESKLYMTMLVLCEEPKDISSTVELIASKLKRESELLKMVLGINDVQLICDATYY